MGMTMAMVPTWLYYLFAVLMLCVTAHSALLLAMDGLSRRTAGWDVELHHGLMGVAMAGMFVGSWSFGPSAMWEVLFGAMLVWFVVRSGHSVLTYGPHLPHTAVHALMSFAMLLMYWFPMDGAHSMASSAGARVDPGLAFVVAFLLLVSAVFTLASDRKGGSVYGTHLAVAATGDRAAAVIGDQESASADGVLAGTTSAAGGLEGLVSRPWLLDGSHVVMCVAMGFMLILML